MSRVTLTQCRRTLIGFGWALILQIGWIRVGFAQPDVTQELPPEQQISLAGEVDLARLVDLCAQRMNLDIEYDAATLKGTVTLRLGGDAGDGISDDELWSLTNQLLSARGFITIRQQAPIGPANAGNLIKPVYSVVKASEAAGLAAVEASDALGESAPGFVSVVVRLQRRGSKELADAAKLVLSKQGGSITPIGDSNLILISDLKNRVDEAVDLIAQLDGADESSSLERIDLVYATPAQATAQVAALSAAQELVDGKHLRGKVVPDVEHGSVIIVAPQREMEIWKSLLAQVDREPGVEMRSYATGYFSPGDVSKLLEQAVKDSGPRSAGDRWKVVTDELTGSLLVTATPRQHEQIENILQRLRELPAESRRPVRSYTIKNRNVKDLAEVLERLITAGVVSTASDVQASGDAISAPTPRTSDKSPSPPPTDAQQSRREIQPTQPANADGASLTSSTSRTTQTASGGRIEAGQPTDIGLRLTADEPTNTIIAIGEPRLLDQLEQLIKSLDVRQPQVMIKVLIVSLTDAQTLDLGVELQKFELAGDTLFTLSSLFGLSTRADDGTPSTPSGPGGSAVILNPGDFNVVIRALQTLNHGRSLSIPNVLVNNNEQATLNAVLQQPFTSTNASDTVATTSFGGTQDAGTTVNVKPQIAEGDHLVLAYSITLSAFVGDSADPTLPPPRQQNNLQSVATIPDGHVVAVGGLELTSKTEAVNQVPLLGSIPLLGEAFKSRSNTKSTSRFFIFIQPDILRQSNFEDLKYLSDRQASLAELDPSWPTVTPRIIR